MLVAPLNLKLTSHALLIEMSPVKCLRIHKNKKDEKKKNEQKLKEILKMTSTFIY